MKKTPKKMKGKSNAVDKTAPVYKPSIYLDDKQIPKALKDAKPGTTVQFMATGKVLSKSERLGEGQSLSIELDKMTASPKKRGGK